MRPTHKVAVPRVSSLAVLSMAADSESSSIYPPFANPAPIRVGSSGSPSGFPHRFRRVLIFLSIGVAPPLLIFVLGTSGRPSRFSHRFSPLLKEGRLVSMSTKPTFGRPDPQPKLCFY